MQNNIFYDILSDITGNNARKANNRKAVRRGEREKTPEYDQKLLSAKRWAETMGHTASVPGPDAPDDLTRASMRLRPHEQKASDASAIPYRASAKNAAKIFKPVDILIAVNRREENGWEIKILQNTRRSGWDRSG